MTQTRLINRLSAKSILTLNRRGRYADGGGLFLAINGNARRWTFVYRDRQTQRKKEMGLGPAPGPGKYGVALADARAKAAEARKVLWDGKCPLTEKRAARAAGATETFGSFADTYVANAAKGFKSEVHIGQWKTSIEVHAATLRPLRGLLRLTGLFGVITSGAKLAYVALSGLITAFGLIPVAIAAAGFAIGFLAVKLVTDWEGTTTKIADLFSTLWALLPKGAQDAISAIAAPFLQLADIVSRVVEGVIMAFTSLTNGQFASNLGNIFSALWSLIQDGASALVKNIVNTFNGIVSGVVTFATAIVQGFQTAWDAVKDGATDLEQWITDRFNDMVTFIQSVPDLISQAMQAGWDAIKEGAADVANWIADQFNKAVSTIKGYLDTLTNWAKSALAVVQSAASAISGAVSSATPAFAGGGYIRGPGTGTSDSVPIRASNGEYIVRAKAVSHYGTALLDAINRQILPLRDLPKFSMGGIVSALTPTVPRFASGGLVNVGALSGGSGLQPVHLHVGGGDYQMFAPPSVVDSLSRYSSGKQVRNAGRKPTWYRG